MSQLFNNKKFKVLEEKWYKKLAKSGFEDIESKSGYLKWDFQQNLNATINHNKEVNFQAREQYFRLAGFFLNDYPFQTAVDKIVWHYHSEGDTIRNIAKRLNANKIKTNPTAVKVTIHRLRDLMFRIYKDFDHE